MPKTGTIKNQVRPILHKVYTREFYEVRMTYAESEFLLLEDEEEDEVKIFNSTPNKDETLQNYLKKVGKIKLLSKENELKIGKTIKTEEKNL